MIDTPQIVQSEALHTAVIRFTIAKHAIQEVMGPAIGEVFATLGAQGLRPAGAVFSYHSRIYPEGWDFEVGVPVPKPVTQSGRVVASQLPARKVARTNYRGGYEGLGAAWGELDAWIAKSKLAAEPSLWEFYAAGPESSPDPKLWRTELNRPLSS